MKSLPFWIVLFLAFGIVLLLISIYIILRIRRFTAHAIQTIGTVVALEPRPSQMVLEGRNRIIYHPVVSYYTQDGMEVIFTGSAGNNPPNYQEGQEIDIIYNRNHPEQAHISSVWSLYLAPILYLGLGLLCVIIALIFLALLLT